MKNFLLAALLLTATLTATAITEVTAPVNVYGRKTISLNGDWKAFVDQQDQGYYDYRMKPTQWGYFLDAKAKNSSDLVEYNFDESNTLKVPGDWNTQSDKLYLYEGTVWYRQKFNYKPESDRRTLLYFGAANYESRVWVNGKEAGHHVGGFWEVDYISQKFVSTSAMKACFQIAKCSPKAKVGGKGR